MANQKQGIWQRIRDWWERPGPRLDAMDGVGVRVVDMTDYHEATIPASRLIAGGQDVDAFLDGILAAREADRERQLDEADALAADIDVDGRPPMIQGSGLLPPDPDPEAEAAWQFLQERNQRPLQPARDARDVVFVDDGLGDEMEADLSRGIGDDD